MSTPGHLLGTPGYRRLLTALFFAGIATFAQLYSPQAVLPLIADDLSVPPATAALTVSVSTLGLALGVIPWSAVADRIGRVRAMAIGVLIATALGLLAPLSPDIPVLLAVRLLEGAALGAIPAIALAYLSEEVQVGHVAAAAGSYIAGTTVGGLSGRLISGPVGELVDWRVGMWATSALCLLAALAFLWLIPPPRQFRPGRIGGKEGPSLAARLGANLRSPAQLALYAQGFLLMGAFVAVFNYVGFHLTDPPFSLPATIVTLLFLSYLAGTVSSPWAGTLAERYGRLPVLIISALIMATGAAIMLVPLIPVILLGLLTFTAGFFGAHAVASGWAPVAAPPSARAQASPLYYLGYYGGSSLFGWCLGFVFSAGRWGTFVGAIVAMALVAAMLAWLALRGLERKPAAA